MKFGLNTPQDFLAMVVRRRWWIVVPFVALMGLATLTIWVLPETYVSEALVLVRPREIPEDMVRSLVSSSGSRLTLIENTLRSRTILREVLDEYVDRMPEMSGLSPDQRFALLGSQIEITFQFEDMRSESALSSFRLAYQNRNPELAQQIAEKLTDLFIREENELRADQTNGTIEFLEDEVADIEEELRAVDEERRVLLSENQQTLPQQQATLVSQLERLTLEKLGVLDQIDQYNGLLIDFEQRLSETPETVPDPAYVAGVVRSDPRIAQYRQAQRDFEDAASRWTERMPQYREAERRLQSLEEELPPDVLAMAQSGDPETPEESGPPMVPNAVYARLAEQVNELRRDLVAFQAERNRLEATEAEYERRLAVIPRTGQLIADIDRRHEVLQTQYDTQQRNLREAQLSGDLEIQQRGSTFQIIDRANLPIAPSKPNKALLLFGALVGSLVVATALAAGVDVARQRVWTQSDVEQFWGVSVLVDIPEIVTDGDVSEQKRQRLKWGVSSAGAAVAYGVVLYGFYLKHEPILQLLDPVLQRIVYR